MAAINPEKKMRLEGNRFKGCEASPKDRDKELSSLFISARSVKAFGRFGCSSGRYVGGPVRSASGTIIIAKPSNMAVAA